MTIPFPKPVIGLQKDQICQQDKEDWRKAFGFISKKETWGEMVLFPLENAESE